MADIERVVVKGLVKGRTILLRLHRWRRKGGWMQLAYRRFILLELIRPPRERGGKPETWTPATTLKTFAANLRRMRGAVNYPRTSVFSFAWRMESLKRISIAYRL